MIPDDLISVSGGRRGSLKETESAGTNGLVPAPEAESLAPYDELADEIQRLTVSEQKEREAAVSEAGPTLDGSTSRPRFITNFHPTCSTNPGYKKLPIRCPLMLI